MPAELIAKLDRRLSRKCIKRAEWLRNVVLKAAIDEGLIKASFDEVGDVYDLDMLCGVAA